MSFEAMTVVLNHSRSKGTDRNVLIGIANHMGDGGAWPSIATLCRYAGGVEERTVQRSIAALVKLGELAVYPQQGGNRATPNGRRTNRYEVLIACPFNCDRTMNHRLIELPVTQDALWITPPTPTSPGDAHVGGGVTSTSGVGVTSTSPEPVLRTSSTPVGEDLTVPRATAMPHCGECFLSYDECTARARVNGHDYSPRRRRPSEVLAPILENYR